jgi:hypothetical protein
MKRTLRVFVALITTLLFSGVCFAQVTPDNPGTEKTLEKSEKSGKKIGLTRKKAPKTKAKTQRPKIKAKTKKTTGKPARKSPAKIDDKKGDAIEKKAK